MAAAAANTKWDHMTPQDSHFRPFLRATDRLRLQRTQRCSGQLNCGPPGRKQEPQPTKNHLQRTSLEMSAAKMDK